MKTNEDDSIVVASNYRLAAVSFWQSAKILHDNRTLTKDGETSLITLAPFYYLVSHACELFLKSALLKRGVTETELKKQNVRHNLNNLSEYLESKGIDLKPNTKTVLHALNQVHERHSLRYKVLISCSAFELEAATIYEALQELLMATRLRRDI